MRDNFKYEITEHIATLTDQEAEALREALNSL